MDKKVNETTLSKDITLEEVHRLMAEGRKEEAENRKQKWIEAHSPKEEALGVTLHGCPVAVYHLVYKRQSFRLVEVRRDISNPRMGPGGGPFLPSMEMVTCFFCKACNCLIPEHLARPGSDDPPPAQNSWFDPVL